jgi:hypothetical protein
MKIQIINVTFQVVVSPDTPHTESSILEKMLNSQEDDGQTLRGNNHAAINFAISLF